MLALQFESDSVGPIGPVRDQARTHRIFPYVFPFFLSRFLSSQQTIETTRSPCPIGIEAFSDCSFYCRGQRSHRGISVTRACQKMDMIRHYHRRYDMPVEPDYRLAKGGKRVVVVQHVSASLDAEGDEINDALIEPE